LPHSENLGISGQRATHLKLVHFFDVAAYSKTLEIAMKFILLPHSEQISQLNQLKEQGSLTTSIKA
jgi:hypothetical protein